VSTTIIDNPAGFLKIFHPKKNRQNIGESPAAANPQSVALSFSLVVPVG
jgi:hypothetical protein